MSTLRSYVILLYVAMLPGSGYHAMYRGSCAGWSRAGCPKCVAISWKSKILSISNCLWCFVVSSLHVHQDTGKVLCRHSNLFAEKVAPNGLADVREFSAVCTPFSKDMKVQFCRLSASELLYLIVFMWMLESQTLLLLIPEHLSGNSPPSLTIRPQLTPRC